MNQEKKYFKKTQDMINKTIQKEEDFLNYLRKDARQHNKEMIAETSQDYSDPQVRVELSQYLQSYQMNEIKLLKSKAKVEKLLTMYKKPYFGRLDFTEEGYDTETLYFGTGHLFNTDTMEILIYDWRSPIASLYYDNKFGQVSYQAPEGMISGDVSLKRQYLIEDGQLIDYYELEENAPDEQLLTVLSSKANSHLKNIVETIQAKQNSIIRMKDLDLLFVRGVPGSGKSIIAMHRLAYLMYQGKQYNNQNIMILSPNLFFKDYLDHVLPELGEKSVQQTTYEDILLNEFPQSEAYKDYMSRLVNKRSTHFQQTEAFYILIKAWFRYYLKHIHHYEDIYYHNHMLISKDKIKSWFLNNYDKQALKVSSDKLRSRAYSDIEYLSKDVQSSLEEIVLKLKNYPLHSKSAVKRKLKSYNSQFKKRMNKILHLDPIHIYQSMFKNKQIVKGLVPFNIPKSFFFKQNGFDDYHGILLYKTWITNISDFKHYKYLVIDEAQDYNPIQYRLIKKLFYNAHFTILGDMNQTLHHKKESDFYKQLLDIFQPKASTQITLDTCYRSTDYITKYANQFIKDQVESFNRQGEPVVIDCLSNLKEYIYDGQLAIIVHSEKEAKQLSKSLGIPSLSNQLSKLNEKQLIIPIYYAKGLEFDRVIYINNKLNHPLHKQWIYTAATRAKHELIVLNED